MVTNYVTHDFGYHGPCDVRDRVKRCRKPRTAVTMDTGEGGGVEFRGSGSVSTSGSGTALNTPSSETEDSLILPSLTDTNQDSKYI